jgi:DNA polymerase-3 subunit epsilon
MHRRIALDTETTGLDPTDGHRITELACVEIVNRRLTGRRFHTYLNPERAISDEAKRITGLSEAFLQDKPKFSEIVSEFFDFMGEAGTELIIHNAPFDLKFLHAELTRIAYVPQTLVPHFRIVDTLVLGRQKFPGQGNSLDALCRRFKIDHTHRTVHGALLDAELLAKMYLAMTAGQGVLALGTKPIPTQTPDSETQTQARLALHTVTRKKRLPVIYATAEELEIDQHYRATLS